MHGLFFEVLAHDQEALACFYTDLFGWSYERGGGGEKSFLYVEGTGSSPIRGGIGHARPNATGSQAGFYVGVVDVEASLARAVELGGKVSIAPKHVDGYDFAEFLDIEDNQVGLVAPFPVPDATAWSVAAVHEHLQAAVELELWTIPLYLTAWYSIKDQTSGAGKEFAHQIRRVVIEEMLHLELACNAANAAGGAPRLVDAAAPRYGEAAPHLRWTDDDKWKRVDLGAVSRDQLHVFSDVERPDASGKTFDEPQTTYASIGDFYDSLASGIAALAAEIPWRPGHNEVTAFNTFGGPSKYKAVDEASGGATAEATALERFRVILSQGEGSGSIDCGQHDLDLDDLPPHFCVFEALRTSSEYPEVFALQLPTGGVYPADVEPLAAFSDALYSLMLDQLQAMFNGEQVDVRAVPQMWLFITPVMEQLVRTTWTTDDGDLVHACPRWKYIADIDAMRLQTMFAELPEATRSALAARGLQLPLVIS